MLLRFFEDADYDTLMGWWGSWEWPVIPRDALPTIGIVAEDDERAWAIGFLYRTDSSIAWVEWLTVNPDAPKEKRREALSAVLHELIESARFGGFRSVFTSVSHPTIIGLLGKHGFVETDRDMINFVRRF